MGKIGRKNSWAPSTGCNPRMRRRGHEGKINDRGTEMKCVLQHWAVHTLTSRPMTHIVSLLSGLRIRRCHVLVPIGNRERGQ